MKKNFLAAFTLAAIIAAGTATALAWTAPGGGITGSRHDINAYAKQNTEGLTVQGDVQERVCAFCHTPHHAYDPAANNADYLPLWSHELTKKNYAPYASDTLQASIGDPLIGPSRLCMSCHDGVVAIDTHYTNANETGSGTSQLTGDIFSIKDSEHGAVGAGDSLISDHPIGFNYIDAKTADKNAGGKLNQGINEESTPFAGNPNNVQIKDVLHLGTTMTCASCHDVHNKDNVASTVVDASAPGGRTESSVNYFVYAPQNGSQLCVTCHNK
ncbi:cytochrome c3 family protein [Geotalea uraniireducens]|uniref:Uncharacterized protein n=1 Tax=Geotalea uraniireducens (strain Rf4) TaxID=351605 RepID=A5G555_GEOUR|nr:cytochrome c3 family protein [Geotalea uraniireducens]ABQ26923.1 hypothetical protein Gura_2749 [Geotalea uraniireducens Rf4]